MPRRAILVNAIGKPHSGNHFTETFREWCDAAGLPKHCKVHGLRKAACRRLAEAEVDGRGIMAITGHATLKELVRYTKDASQPKLARNAMVKAITRTKGETKVSGTGNP